MAALAVRADLEAVLGRSITDTDEQTRVDRLLDMASDVFRDAVRQTISAVEDDTVDILDIPVESDLWLPERPVTAISSIVLNGQTLDPSAYRFFPTGLVRRTGWISWGGGYSWPTLEVTYDHGWATVPTAIVTRVCELARDANVNPSGVKSETLDGYAIEYGTRSRMALDDDDPVVARYRPVIASVPVQTGVVSGRWSPMGSNW